MNTESSLSFAAFGLSDAVLGALTRKGFVAPSSIQALALPRLLADEGHLVAKARTGTGKTAAFGIPLVERLTTPGKLPRALILAPTRELALQVSQEIRSLAGGPFPRVCAVYGGASMGAQLRDLSRGVEVVVGTPGRVMDHLERGSLDLSAVEWMVLDEADEMLDMGFLEDVEAIMDKVNPDRRVALFSATMPAPILKIVRDRLGEVDIVEDRANVDEKPAIDQFYVVLRREDKLEALPAHHRFRSRVPRACLLRDKGGDRRSGSAIGGRRLRGRSPPRRPFAGSEGANPPTLPQFHDDNSRRDGCRGQRHRR